MISIKIRPTFQWIALSFGIGSVIAASIAPPMANGQWPYTATTTVEKLAKKIDQLEAHIDHYGTIVTKQPDIWGESRLMQHRSEYERHMAAQINKFDESFQGSVARSDQAFLATAFSLQAAISGQAATLTTPTGTVTETVTENSKQTASTTSNKDLGTDGKTTSSASDKQTNSTETGSDTKDSNSISKTALNPPLIPADPAVITSIESSIDKNKTTAPLGFGSKTLSLEPTELLNQRSRYLNHLHELRRINEGDDTADAPGYSLDLVRVPVSILPGKKTREGYGAEITITVNSEIGDEVLPVTFRNWVVKDLVTQFSIPLTGILNDGKLRELLPGFKQLIKHLETIEKTRDDWNASLEWEAEVLQYDSKEIDKVNVFGSFLKGVLDSPESAASFLKSIAPDLDIPSGQQLAQSLKTLTTNTASPNLADIRAQLNALLMKHTSSGGDLISKSTQFAFPFSQFHNVYGHGYLLHAVWEGYIRLGQQDNNDVIHYHNVESYLTDELRGAYELLDRRPSLWRHATDELVTVIRERNSEKLNELRDNFASDLVDSARTTTTAIYGWAIIVNAALLNDRLLRDMKETAANRACPCISGDWMPFYLPDPPPEARLTFRQYVQCRWPIHVFSIDPVIDEQNIADKFGMRREMQLAISLAFASGHINAQHMMRFVRRLEMEMQTIDLNRTAVGFSHGDSTFGWRFYPRLQSPPTENNFRVAGQLVFGGPSRDHLTNRRMLEPGMRECIALVVRPSFIPQVTFDVRSNWFRMTNPQKSHMSMSETIALSKDIREMQDLATACYKDQHKYREGESYRLLRRVEQLSAELPLQTLRTDVPDDATDGGFAIFNAGTTAMAPRLYSWYGCPGFDTSKETSLFLIGENFGVQGTRVIAGNLKMSPTTSSADNDEISTTIFKGSAEKLGADSRVELLSQRVMRVTVPAGARPVIRKNIENKDAPYIELHVATPYGVSQVLQVPVVASLEQQASASAKSADDALKQHVADMHLDQYSFKESGPFTAIVCRSKTGQVSGCQFCGNSAAKSLTLQSTSDLPFSTTEEGQICFSIIAKTKDDKQIGQKGKTQIVDISENKKSISLLSLEGTLLEFLKKLGCEPDLDSVYFQGYFITPGKQDRPTFKVGNPIKIELKFEEVNLCFKDCPPAIQGAPVPPPDGCPKQAEEKATTTPQSHQETTPSFPDFLIPSTPLEETAPMPEDPQPADNSSSYFLPEEHPAPTAKRRTMTRQMSFQSNEDSKLGTATNSSDRTEPKSHIVNAAGKFDLQEDQPREITTPSPSSKAKRNFWPLKSAGSSEENPPREPVSRPFSRGIRFLKIRKSQDSDSSN